jgi:hypothetical protein
MSFDELQQQWKDEPSGDVQIPSEMDVLKKAITPIEKLRKRMRKDFFLQNVIVLISGIVLIYWLDSFEKRLSFTLFYVVIITFSGYYTVKFLKFYKTLNTINFSSRKNLDNIYFDLKMNLELYKSQNFHFMYGNFIFLSFASFIGTGQKRILFIEEIVKGNYTNLLIIIAIIIIAPIPAYFSSENLGGMQYYKSHLDNIEKIYVELDEL